MGYSASSLTLPTNIISIYLMVVVVGTTNISATSINGGPNLNYSFAATKILISGISLVRTIK